MTGLDRYGDGRLPKHLSALFLPLHPNHGPGDTTEGENQLLQQCQNEVVEPEPACHLPPASEHCALLASTTSAGLPVGGGVAV